MEISKLKKIRNILIFFALFLSFFYGDSMPLEKDDVTALHSLLPEVGTWKFSEAPQEYFPETLFEYINGAAEIYLAYDFKQLIVCQYKRANSEASLSIEIYDMGDEKRSFGIYSVERFPGSEFKAFGNQGYLEEGVLNFIIGKYYVKLLCFDCGKESDSSLELFSSEIVKKVKDKGHLPSTLKLFPEEELVQNSEKFILRNFFGYSFLHSGYLANYKLDDFGFDCFLIEGKNAEDAQSMLDQYLNRRNKNDIQEIPLGYRIKDRYYHNIYMARIGSYICGTMKINDEFEEVGKKYFKMLIKNLKK